MRSWDDMVDFYQQYVEFTDKRDSDFGKGMLDLIRVLRSDPEINALSLGSMMNWLVVALPDDDLKSVHIQYNQWITPDTYEIFLTPLEINQQPDAMTVSLSEVVAKVKELLCLTKKD